MKGDKRRRAVRVFWQWLAETGACVNVQGEWRPVKTAVNPMSYGEWVKDAADEMLDRCKTAEDVAALAMLVRRIGASIIRG